MENFNFFFKSNYWLISIYKYLYINPTTTLNEFICISSDRYTIGADTICCVHVFRKDLSRCGTISENGSKFKNLYYTLYRIARATKK